MPPALRFPCRAPRCAALLLLAACGGRREVVEPRNVVTPLRRLALAEVWELEAGGTPPADTVVVFAPGAPRLVVLRHGVPDQAAFAVLEFPADAFAGADSVRVSVSPRPGVYGLDLAASQPIRAGRITFKYAHHFTAPVAARTRYQTDVGFEKVLAVGRLAGDSIVLLPTSRPASDNVAAALDGPGSYVVAGAR
jgi:hypothetical protein